MQVIAHNLTAQYTNRQLSISTDKKSKSAEKLSSGYRINRSADDAAGLKISEKMRSQIRGLDQASRNIEDGVSLCQVADGALNETHAILQRMRELSVQAANDTNQEIDREAIQAEIDEIKKEVVRIGEDTTFNSKPVFAKGLMENIPPNIIDPINNTSLQIPQGIEIAINSTNINTILTMNADGSFELEDGVIYTISSDVQNVAFHISSGSTVSIKNSDLKMCSVICDSAKLYIADVTIDNTTSSGALPSGWEGAPISCKGSSEINYIGTNSLLGGRYKDTLGLIRDYAAVEVLSGESVELNGNGKLTCIGGDAAAGIGANWNSGEIDAGKIVINSGSIYSYSGNVCWGAGIGGAYEGNGGTVIVNGGYVYANGGGGGAGIGSGAIISQTYTDGGTVEINGGIVYAESNGYDGAAGIGGGYGSSGANVIITGGDVTAIGGAGGAGIGSGVNMDFKNINSGNVTISGGKVSAVGSSSAMQQNYDEYVQEGSAIGQGAMFGNATVKQYWENGFGTTCIDGVVVDTKVIGRDSSSIKGGHYSFNYDNLSIVDNVSQQIKKQGDWWIQMGANTRNGVFVNMGSLEETTQQINNISVLSYQDAEEAIESLDIAINLVSKQRTMIGAQQNRLEHAKAVDDIISENTQAAESRIRDSDMASEMVEYSKNNILEQFGQSMLAQANQMSQNVLSLLQ